MRNLLRRVGRVFHIGEDADYLMTILEWLGFKKIAMGLLGATALAIWEAYDGATWPERILYWFAALAIILALIALGVALKQRIRGNGSHESEGKGIKEVAQTLPAPEPTADIDARAAFFQILEKSEWSAKQLANPPDPKTRRNDWLKIRLETEIHNCLAQNRLTAWGETSLPHSTGPQRKIKPEEWEQSKILFDDINPNMPRTMAKWLNNDRGSLFGIMFSKDQIFRLFPLSSSEEWTPVHLAIEHISNRIGDIDENDCFPEARRLLRQRAYDQKIKLRGRKQLADRPLFRNDEYSEIHTNIDPQYWATSEINELSTSSDPKTQTNYHTDPQTAYAWGPSGMDERNRYAQLLVNWADILREWPQ